MTTHSSSSLSDASMNHETTPNLAPARPSSDAHLATLFEEKVFRQPDTQSDRAQDGNEPSAEEAAKDDTQAIQLEASPFVAPLQPLTPTEHVSVVQPTLQSLTEQIVQAMAVMSGPNMGSMVEIQLQNVSFLNGTRIQIALNQGELSVRFQGQSEQALSFLRKHSKTLEDHLHTKKLEQVQAIHIQIQPTDAALDAGRPEVYESN